MDQEIFNYKRRHNSLILKDIRREFHNDLALMRILFRFLDAMNRFN